MLITELVVVGLTISVEQLVETQFGVPGLIALLLMRTGVVKRSFGCVVVGVAVMAALVLA